MILGATPIGTVELAGLLSPIPAVVTTKTFTLFLSGVDQTNLLLADTLNITNPLSQTSTCSFSLWDPTGVFHATVGQEIAVYHNSTKVFGGTIDEVIESAKQAQKGVWAEIRGSDFGALLDRRIIGNFYQSPQSLPGIVSDIVFSKLSADGIIYDSRDGDPGVAFGDQLFNWITVRQAFNQLASLVGWDFNVDFNKVLRFFPKSTGLSSAPFNIADNDGNWLAESMKVRTYRGKYRNQQYVRTASQPTALWTEIFSAANPGLYPSNKQPPGNGRIAFITLYKIEVTPVVKVNGNAKRVITLSQVAGADPASWDWYYIPGASGVFQNQAQAPLVSTDILEVDYQTRLSPVFLATCAAQIAARASAEGNSGLYEDVQDAPNITNPVALNIYATGLVNRYGCNDGIPTQVTYESDKDGLLAGMLQTINTSNPKVNSHSYLLTQIIAREIGKKFLRYTVTADIGEYLGDWAQFFSAIVNRGQLAQPGSFVSYEWPIAPSYPGYVNPGQTGGGTLSQTKVVQNQVELLQYVSAVFNSLPASPAMTLQLLVNGNGTGTAITPVVVNQEVRFYFANSGSSAFQVFAGDLLSVLIAGSPTASHKDGVFKLVTSIGVA